MKKGCKFLNMEKVTKNATVPEDVREQISAAIDHVERIMQEQLPTDYQQSRLIVMEQVPILDRKIATLIEFKNQLEDQSFVRDQRLIDKIVSTVRVGNEWAMQVVRKDLELSPISKKHKDVELVILQENGKQPVDVFFGNFD